MTEAAAGRAPRPDVSVVTITYDEAENIGPLIDALRGAFAAAGARGEIVVVDDESPDGTAAVVEAYARRFPEVRLIVRRGERGIGSAYWRGVEEARGEVVVTMDADFSHPPDRLGALLSVARGGAFVSGSRLITGGFFNTSWYRLVGTKTLNVWLYYFLRLGVWDHTNGYLAARTEDLRRVTAAARSVGVDPFGRALYGFSVFAFARRLGFQVVEVPAPYIFRTRGETKIPFFAGVRMLVEDIAFSFRLRAAVDRLPAPGEAKQRP